MTGRSRGRTLLLTGLLLVACLPPVVAGPGPRRGPGVPSLPPELNLTPTQKERLDALSARVRGVNLQLARQLEGRRRELEGTYGRFEMDELRARRLRGEIHEIQGQILELHHSFQLDLRRILTADQFATLQAARRQRRAPHGRRWRGPAQRAPATPTPSSERSGGT